MEILIALIASYNAHRQQERVVAEPEELQPFDLQALRKTTDSKPSRSMVSSTGTPQPPLIQRQTARDCFSVS